MRCGLLGRKLGHSYSPRIHRDLGAYSYALYEKEPEELEAFLKHGDFTGLNVTIPYKRDVIPFLDALSPTAQKMNAVNTIVRRPDGTLFGHNTDYYGFTSLVRHSGMEVSGKKVLVLGSGGTSGTAVKSLEDLGAQAIVISRSGKNNYQNLHLHRDAAVIVNTTPVGMYPNTGAAPVDLKEFPHLEGVLDVIYNPSRTQLLLDAEQLGLPNANGLWMLVAQAKESAEYFTGQTMDEDVIAAIHRKLSAHMENIILIGMPGCGKSTIAALLGQALDAPVVDADQQIAESAGMPIPRIFALEGETGFRRWETQVLARLGKSSGLIIATGGGCVTRPENYPLLHQNGRIFWLTRDLSLLPTQGRPLSESIPLTRIYAQRKPWYQSFSDYVIDNNGTPEDTVKAILACLEAPAPADPAERFFL